MKQPADFETNPFHKEIRGAMSWMAPNPKSDGSDLRDTVLKALGDNQHHSESEEAIWELAAYIVKDYCKKEIIDTFWPVWARVRNKSLP